MNPSGFTLQRVANALGLAPVGVAASGSVNEVLHVIEEHMHSESKVYPTRATGKTVTTGNGAWVQGAWSEIVPVNTITTIFDLHGIMIEACSDTGVYELEIGTGGAGAEAVVATIRFPRTAQEIPSELPIQTARFAANSRISGRISSSGGTNDAVVMSIRYHTY